MFHDSHPPVRESCIGAALARTRPLFCSGGIARAVNRENNCTTGAKIAASFQSFGSVLPLGSSV